MKQWEYFYDTINIVRDGGRERIATLGQEGWEMCGCYEIHDNFCWLIFKRQITENK